MLISIAAVPSPLSVKETNAGCPDIENVKSSLSASAAEMATDFATPSVYVWLPMAASTGAVFGTGSTVRVIVSVSVSVSSVTVITISA